MIRLTRRNGDEIVVNLRTIAYVERAPDTLVTLINGERLHVRESVDAIVERAHAYERAAHGAPTVVEHEPA